MYDNIFESIYMLGLIYASVVRTKYGMRFSLDNVLHKKNEHPLVYVGMALWGIVLILPLFHIFSTWLDFANYQLPVSLSVIGSVIFIAGLYVLQRSHANLGNNFSPTLSIQKQHTLITEGIYKYIRHPMYLSFWCWAIGQSLLISNWIAGPPGIIAFYLIYSFRINHEEQQLVEHFGDAYQDYTKSTGRIFPKLK